MVWLIERMEDWALGFAESGSVSLVLFLQPPSLDPCPDFRREPCRLAASLYSSVESPTRMSVASPAAIPCLSVGQFKAAPHRDIFPAGGRALVDDPGKYFLVAMNGRLQF